MIHTLALLTSKNSQPTNKLMQPLVLCKCKCTPHSACKSNGRRAHARSKCRIDAMHEVRNAIKSCAFRDGAELSGLTRLARTRRQHCTALCDNQFDVRCIHHRPFLVPRKTRHKLRLLWLSMLIFCEHHLPLSDRLADPLPHLTYNDIAATEFADSCYLCKVRSLSNAAQPASNAWSECMGFIIWQQCPRWRI